MELTIDTADALAGVALTDEGAPLAERLWRTRAGHAAELLPAIRDLLAGAGVAPIDLDAVFVCLGPGSYAGLRVGISTALALAFGLPAGLLGVARLEADAWLHAAYPGPIVPVHSAGRGSYAWSVYHRQGGWRQTAAATLTDAATLLATAPAGALLCGEPPAAAQATAAGRDDLSVLHGPAHARRPLAVSALAWPRYAAGERDSHLALEPLYLREPHITPSRAARAQAEATAPSHDEDATTWNAR